MPNIKKPTYPNKDTFLEKVNKVGPIPTLETINNKTTYLIEDTLS